jgi:hypothetical protein
MSIPTENPKGLDQISVEDLTRPFHTNREVMQLHDQVAMLEAEVDKQDKIIKLFAELLFLTCGDKHGK